MQVTRPALGTLACLCLFLSGCRLFMSGKELSATREAHAPVGWNDQAFDQALGDQSKSARDVMLAFGNTIGSAYLGRLESRADVTPQDGANFALKSEYAEFLSPEAVAKLQAELVIAMAATANEGAFEFLGCNKSPWQRLAKFMNTDVKELFKADYKDLLSADIPAGTEARLSCGSLLEKPSKDKTVFFEFFVDGEPGHMRQYVQVRRARGWPAEIDRSLDPRTLRETPAPALFRARQKLKDNVAIVVRPHSKTKKLGMQLLPTASNFNKETSDAARRLLGFNASGIFNDDPVSLSDLSRQWYAGQEHALQSRIALSGFQTAVVVASGGALAAQASALQAALASGTQLGGFEIASFAVRLGAASFGLAGEILDLSELKDSIEMMDHDERRKALDVSVMVLNAAGAGFGAASFALHSVPVVKSAMRVYFDSRILADAARQGGHTAVTQMSIEEFKALGVATGDVFEAEWAVVEESMKRAQDFNAAQIAAVNAANDGAFLRIANAYKTVAGNFPTFAGFVTQLGARTAESESRIRPGHYGCDVLTSHFRWNGCELWMSHRAELLKETLPPGFTGEALWKSFEDCGKAGGKQCRKKQIYCLTTIWDDDFNACVAKREDGCVLKKCATPEFFGE